MLTPIHLQLKKHNPFELAEHFQLHFHFEQRQIRLISCKPQLFLFNWNEVISMRSRHLFKSQIQKAKK